MAKIFDFLAKKDAEKIPERTDRKVFIKTFPIHEADDAEEVIEYLRLGTTIAMLKVKSPIHAFDAIKRIKDACTELNGEVVGIAPNVFMAVPKNVEIVKRQPNDIFIKQVVEETAEEIAEEPKKEETASASSIQDEGWEDFSLGETSNDMIDSDYPEIK